MKRSPVFTWTFVAVALLAGLIPAVSSALLYDRAAILHGELWRLLTGHVVHFSGSHLVLNLAAFALTGWLLETRTDGPRGILFLATPLLISSVLWLGEPLMTCYGGLSGMITAFTVYLALDLAGGGKIARLTALGAMAAVLLKLVGEQLLAHPLFANLPGEATRVSTLSHLAGAAIGWLAYQNKRSAQIGRSRFFLVG